MKPTYENTNNIYGALKRTCSACGDVVMIHPQEFPYERFCRYCGTPFKNEADDFVNDIKALIKALDPYYLAALGRWDAIEVAEETKDCCIRLIAERRNK